MSNDQNPGLTLIIVRHSQAEDAERFAQTGRPDCERPLTEQGIKRMNRAAKGLRKLLGGADRVLTSPCARAEHTARILARALDDGAVESIEVLAPGAEPETVAQALTDASVQGVVLLVGHEPDLSRLIAWLCTGRKTPMVDMKKGAACAVHFDAAVDKGRGTILWLMTQAQLRKL
ncbi:putative phosphohistidine phosphatase, SixA [Thioalkalivibrio sulfidiphilus HL-EbGr7]|uniref:Putative phosphohistidine phosphatase, SixA n=1 Tax=Thioalkalivibrio sulfidiphilus (strain HL-EbGR7) TaxID=396588 RepID=B8GLJ1_THISH|nr:phosphohistidine phosphatase SixA [Thioalkalivibrio sulfidiphilus]ACL73546.1 putative phosphohistidine phosphatase, SixA [Thioalkalivibrio sulfidiphilus HL-EbGr7]